MVIWKFLDKDNKGQGFNAEPNITMEPAGPTTPPTATTVPPETTVATTEAPDIPDIPDPEPVSFLTNTVELFGYDVPIWIILLVAVLVVLTIIITAVTIRKNKQKKRRAAATRVDPRAMAAAQAAPIPTTATPAAAPVAAPTGPMVTAAVYQHIGARNDQQDSYGVSEPAAYAQCGVMAIVADGMGGLANGRAVSSALVRTFQDGFRYAGPGTDAADLMLDLATRANSTVNQMLRGQERSGSTLVAALIRGGMLHFLTVGDSRIYLYRGGALMQLNREHIYQEELAVKALNQVVSLQQVKGDRQAHSLTSYFGIGRIPAMDRNYEGIKLVDGDKLLLASDGVFGTLTQAQMEAAMGQNVQDAARTLGDWVLSANRPHQDNNTAVVLEYRA